MRLETRYIDIEKSISIIDRSFHIDFISTISIIYGNTRKWVSWIHSTPYIAWTIIERFDLILDRHSTQWLFRPCWRKTLLSLSWIWRSRLLSLYLSIVIFSPYFWLVCCCSMWLYFSPGNESRVSVIVNWYRVTASNDKSTQWVPSFFVFLFNCICRLWVISMRGDNHSNV